MNETLKNLLADVLQIPAASINGELTMKDVDSWDSLKHMELITSIEQSYKIELTFEEIVTMQSVAAIKRVLEARGAAN